MKGTKHDQNKLRWSLLPLKSLKEIVKVLELGSQKYEDNNWKKVSNPKDRYYNALLRHLFAWKLGEIKDPESGKNHLIHVGCNALFLIWFDIVGD